MNFWENIYYTTNNPFFRKSLKNENHMKYLMENILSNHSYILPNLWYNNC